MLNLNFCVEAFSISGQSNTQEKKMCSVLYVISSYESFKKKLLED